MMLGMVAVSLLLAIPESRAQSQDSGASSPVEPLVMPLQLVPPPLSTAKEQFFRENPAAWSQFLSQLPRRLDVPPQSTPQPAIAAFTGGTWQSPCCTSFFPTNPLLLTDGTVIAHAGSTADWYKLTPDINGSYVNGTWSQIASLPVINGTQYAPLYFASAVLPDGRVIIMGGEYNGGVGDHTNMGAIYDPVADSWEAVSPPTGAAWFAIGDAQSTVLADGTFLLAACCGGSPTADALFDAATLSWTATGGPSNSYSYSYQDEQGYELLPNGNVLTIDIWDSYPTANTTNAEQYDPSSGTWISAGNTPVPLADPYKCGNWEIGPAVMRPDGTLVAFGGNTGCKGVPKPDPTAIYDTVDGVWTAGRNIPALCAANGTTSCSLADAPAALLPDGNILFAASAGGGSQPTHFFEYASSDAIKQVADTVFCAGEEPSYAVNFLVLPNGQILATDLCNAPEFYTPSGVPKASWSPVITSHPKKVTPGGSYTIVGTQFNGLSQGAYYGDDVQGATNYPIVRITNTVTGHVFYARTANHSTMSIAPGAAGSTTFTVPAVIETGTSDLVVIANGIASKHVTITVE
jgi:Kelch motif